MRAGITERRAVLVLEHATLRSARLGGTETITVNMTLQAGDFALIHVELLPQAAVLAAKAELARANQVVPGELSLLEATLLYRSGQTAAAWRLSDQLLTRVPAAADVIARTQFLRGLMAAERGDTARLREASVAMEAIDDTRPVELRADRDELRGYLALTEDEWEVAVQAFDAAATHRRASLDYAGMVRVLAKAGEAAERGGRRRAAGIYYWRAGRSAALQGQKQVALDWCSRAESLARQARDTRTLQDIRAFLTLLQKGEQRQDGVMR